MSATGSTPQTTAKSAPPATAAAAAPKPLRKKVYVNLVRKDGVIKEQIRQEELTRQSYDTKWGHMKNFNGNLDFIGDQQERWTCFWLSAFIGTAQSLLPAFTQCPPPYKLRICLQIAKDKGIPEEIYIKHHHFKQEPKIKTVSTWEIPSSDPVPTTTTGEVGWRSSRLGCNLERLGPLYISPRHTLNPPGAEPELPISSIILG